MKQLDNKETSQELKPKRGRPRKADALTGAERAKRFRDARRALPKSVTVTENDCEECAILRDEVRRLKLKIGTDGLQAIADSITIKKKDAIIVELRRELARVKQPPNKRNVTEVDYQDVVINEPSDGEVSDG